VNIPSFWLTRPDFDFAAHLEQLEAMRSAALNGESLEDANVPVWAFLCWLCESQGFVAHGTGSADIALFEPRQSNDVGWFGNRKAVYAASDGIWAMFFAVMNRPAVPMTISNAAVNIEMDGAFEPRYFFGASRHAVEGRAYRDGWVYLLPGERFEREPGGTWAGVRFESHHLASLEAVRPAFRVAVRPQDFPFLERIHAFDDDELAARVARDPNGFPWLETPES
jgi:hypothetical protein